MKQQLNENTKPAINSARRTQAIDSRQTASHKFWCNKDTSKNNKQ